MLAFMMLMGSLYIQTNMYQQTNGLHDNPCSQHNSTRPNQQTQTMCQATQAPGAAANRSKNACKSKIRMQLNKQPPNNWENACESGIKSHWNQQPSDSPAPTSPDGSKEKHSYLEDQHKGSRNSQSENTTKVQELVCSRQNLFMSSSDIMNM